MPVPNRGKEKEAALYEEALDNLDDLEELAEDDIAEGPLTPEQLQLVEDNMGLVEHVIRHKMQNWIQSRIGAGIFVDFDDMRQEGYLALMQAARCYNPEKGKFSVYACEVIYHHLINIYIVRPQRQRKGKGAIPVYLDEPISDGCGDSFGHNEAVDTVGDLITADEDPYKAVITRIDIEEFLNGLSSQHRFIVEMRMNGFTYEQIAYLLDMRQQSVGLKLQAIREDWIRFNKGEPWIHWRRLKMDPATSEEKIIALARKYQWIEERYAEEHPEYNFGIPDQEARFIGGLKWREKRAKERERQKRAEYFAKEKAKEKARKAKAKEKAKAKAEAKKARQREREREKKQLANEKAKQAAQGK